MPFGLGLGEMILVMVVFVAPIIAILFGAAVAARRLTGSPETPGLDAHELTRQLQDARRRIEELEERLDQVDEKATFTQRLLEDTRRDP